MEKVKKRILVAVDGSDNSKRAVLEARRHMRMFDAEVSLITVINPNFPDYHHFVDSDEVESSNQFTSESHPALDEALDLLDTSPEEVMIHIKVGDPADQILAVATAGDYDLIIMGSRGRGLFSKTFLGSVSNKVLNYAKTNVLIVK